MGNTLLDSLDWHKFELDLDHDAINNHNCLVFIETTCCMVFFQIIRIKNFLSRFTEETGHLHLIQCYSLCWYCHYGDRELCLGRWSVRNL